MQVVPRQICRQNSHTHDDDDDDNSVFRKLGTNHILEKDFWCVPVKRGLKNIDLNDIIKQHIEMLNQ